MTKTGRPTRAGWRDAVLFLTGLGLTVHEAIVYAGPERWGLLMLFAGMMGTPVFLRGDERRQANGTSPDPPTAAPEAPS